MRSKNARLVFDGGERGRYCVGLFSTLVLFFGTSLAVRPNWIQSWIHTVLAYHQYTQAPLVTEVLAAPLGPRAAGPATFLMFAALMIIAVVFAQTFSARKEGREMSIEVACQCGKILKAKDEHVGLKAKCPSCGAIVDIRIATSPRPVVPEGVDLPGSGRP